MKHTSNSKVLPNFLGLFFSFWHSNFSPSKSGNTNLNNLFMGKKSDFQPPRCRLAPPPLPLKPAFERCFDRRPLAVQCPRVAIPNLAVCATKPPGEWWRHPWKFNGWNPPKIGGLGRWNLLFQPEVFSGEPAVSFRMFSGGVHWPLGFVSFCSLQYRCKMLEEKPPTCQSNTDLKNFEVMICREFKVWKIQNSIHNHH